MKLDAWQQQLKQKHEDDWPKYALLRFAELEHNPGVRHDPQLLQEHLDLLEWLLAMIQIGVRVRYGHEA